MLKNRKLNHLINNVFIIYFLSGNIYVLKIILHNILYFLNENVDFFICANIIFYVFSKFLNFITIKQIKKK